LGIDSSVEMIRLAQANYPAARCVNLQFKVQDATQLNYHQTFDVVFSNAALHWVVDHQPVLAGIKAALKSSGKVLLQMGGKGNAAEILGVLDTILARPPWDRYFKNFSFPYSFYDIEKYRILLERVGLVPIRVELIPKDMVYDNIDQLKGWIRTTWLPYTHRIPPSEQESFIQEVAERYLELRPVDKRGKIHVAMMRMEVEASRGS